MLDFCEVVGRAITDKGFREALYAKMPVVANAKRTDSAVIFTKTEYEAIHDFLKQNVPTRFSHSLAVCGEVIRVLGGFRADVDALAGLNLAVPTGASPDFYSALGALTIDMVQRQEFKDNAGLAMIGSIPIGTFRTQLDQAVQNPAFVARSVKFCEDAWSRGCIIRLKPYKDHQHPDPALWKDPQP